MVVKALITNVANDAELTALTGMARNTVVYHTTNDKVYIYEPKFSGGYIGSFDGGFWVEDNIEKIDLLTYKTCRFKEIDERTEELIFQGFTYKSKVFSMSDKAQLNILELDEIRNDASIVYPVVFNTIDDFDSYSVIDADDLHAMYIAEITEKELIIANGTVLKESIRTAIDEAAVALIIDNR